MRLDIGIAGAGLLGRLLAWRLAHAGHRVAVFDPAPDAEVRHDGRGAAAFSAAGMLSPLAESEVGGEHIAQLGWRSMALWRDIASALPGGAAATLRQHGSLLLAHRGDGGAAQRLLSRMVCVHERPQALDAATQAALEPALARGLLAWQLPGEGQVLPEPLLAALHADAPGVHWRWGRSVAAVEPGRLVLDDGDLLACDLAIDVRGLGARPPLPLRGVRGELIWLHAPGLALQRPQRLVHPRHPVYLVPRPGDIVVLGATEIESEDRSPVSLRSAVELMAAAHSVLPELAEARIVHLETNLRPALPDNLPLTHHEPGLLRINGLYRHGWLVAPALVEDALAALRIVAPAEEVTHA
ncbi:FAD-dependent oxidoreductase [Aquincola sp. S2]|uniref:FAD-dependent oxidoreductase n=1 Tax=Pseudaquabacterium terrae TaxID=2732868 RepID=A0ABX2ESJ2_9BURK|nr:FAD-dependent oxidoreductase [Aquabacterium terrae]NRF71470.1 FAD-dependent oxidoreductase [Aquabacterium terrae]